MSSIVQAHVDLLDALEAVEPAAWGLAKPSIGSGRDRDMGHESIVLGVVNGDGQDWVTLGARTRDEQYAIDLYVTAIRPGMTDREALARAWELWAVVEDVVVSSVLNGPLGGSAGAFNVEMRTPRGIPTTEEEGRGYVIQSAVRFTARLRS